MDHYSIDNRHLAGNRKEISFRFWCFSVSLITNNGMFSKDSVDFDTRVLFSTLRKHEEELRNQLPDMGCDYGVVGIVTKKVWPDKQIKMVDVNPRTVKLARGNAEKNSTEANIHVSDVYEQADENILTDTITNPPTRAGRSVIYNISEEAWNHLVDQGILWVIIRKQQGVRSAVTKMKEVFGNCDIIHRKKGYFILEAGKALTA